MEFTNEQGIPDIRVESPVVEAQEAMGDHAGMDPGYSEYGNGSSESELAALNSSLRSHESIGAISRTYELEYIRRGEETQRVQPMDFRASHGRQPNTESLGLGALYIPLYDINHSQSLSAPADSTSHPQLAQSLSDFPSKRILQSQRSVPTLAIQGTVATGFDGILDGSHSLIDNRPPTEMDTRYPPLLHPTPYKPDHRHRRWRSQEILPMRESATGDGPSLPAGGHFRSISDGFDNGAFLSPHEAGGSPYSDTSSDCSSFPSPDPNVHHLDLPLVDYCHVPQLELLNAAGGGVGRGRTLSSASASSTSSRFSAFEQPSSTNVSQHLPNMHLLQLSDVPPIAEPPSLQSFKATVTTPAMRSASEKTRKKPLAFKCKYCQGMFSSKFSRDRHENSHLNKKVKCRQDNCTREFGNPSDAMRHFKKAHVLKEAQM